VTACPRCGFFLEDHSDRQDDGDCYLVAYWLTPSDPAAEYEPDADSEPEALAS